MKARDLILYVDPYLSTYAERVTQGMPNEHVRMMSPPMRPEEVSHADLVLCTHDHADHIDPDGIPVIARTSPGAAFVVPQCARQTMLDFGIAPERIHTLKGDDSLVVKGVRISAIPAKHEQFDKDETNGFPYLSYVLELDGVRLLHAGDTIPYDGQAGKLRAHEVQLAMLPINGRDEARHRLKFEGNFTCREAVECAAAIHAETTIPMHYGMFTLNTAEVADFVAEAEAQDLKYKVMTIGERLVYPEGG